MSNKNNKPTLADFAQCDGESELVPIPGDGYLIQQIGTPLEEDTKEGKPWPFK